MPSPTNPFLSAQGRAFSSWSQKNFGTVEVGQNGVGHFRDVPPNPRGAPSAPESAQRHSFVQVCPVIEFGGGNAAAD
jgi:hypothetical protein